MVLRYKAVLFLVLCIDYILFKTSFLSVFTIYVAVVLGQYFHVFSCITLHSCTNTTDIRNGMDTRIMGEERRETEMEDVGKNDMEMKERVGR